VPRAQALRKHVLRPHAAPAAAKAAIKTIRPVELILRENTPRSGVVKFNP